MRSTSTRGPGNPNLVKGGPSLNPKGRPRGARGKTRQLLDRTMAAARSGADPFEMLLAIARRDPAALAALGIPAKVVTFPIQFDALKEASKYTRPKPPTSIDATVYSKVTVAPSTIQLLTDEQLAALSEVIRLTTGPRWVEAPAVEEASP